jgi:hypothetical protein
MPDDAARALLAHEIRSKRVAKGYTQAEVGDWFGLTGSAIARYENRDEYNQQAMKVILFELDRAPSRKP